MLKKNSDFEVPPDDQFKNDKLNRKGIIVNCTKLITGLEQPFVLSINSPWGTGKTAFIKMWNQYLRNENFATLYFNAWENDFSNEPLISLIGEIKEQLAEGDKAKGEIKKRADSLAEKGGKIIKQSLPVLSKILVKYVLKLDDIKELTDAVKLENLNQDFGDFVSEQIEKKIEEDSSNKNIQKEFREVLAKFSEYVIAEKEYKKPIVFFIDELDRCKPDYAVKLLESIKHLFNINNFVFVLALDRKQLGFSVQTLYGSKMDSEGYLKRFIDINYNLPELSRKDFIEFLFDVYSLSDITVNLYGGGNLHAFFRSVFVSISEVFELSLRELEHCFTYMRVILTTLNTMETASLYLMCFLIPLRIKKVDVCDDYIYGRTDSKQLIVELNKEFKKAEVFFSNVENYPESSWNFRFDMNIGINLEYFLEVAHLNDWMKEEDYKKTIPDDTPGLEKLGEVDDAGVEKQIIKKWLLHQFHIQTVIQRLESLKKALEFAGSFK